MNLRQIEVFKAIMEGGTVTKAAHSLNIAQPSVSKHLKLLEHNLGFPLFDRLGNKLVATAEGQALFDQVERIYTGVGFLRKFAEDLRHNQHGELTIAAMPLIAQKWLPECVAGFIADHRKVSFSLPVRSSKWIAGAVASRRVDFGVGLKLADTNYGIRTLDLMKLPLVCVMPPDHPLACNKIVHKEQMRGHGMISLQNFEAESLMFEDLAEDLQSSDMRRIGTFSTNMACELVQQGAGIALVDILTANNSLSEALTFRPLDPITHVEICIMIPEHWPMSGIAKELIDVLIERARAMEPYLDNHPNSAKNFSAPLQV